MPYPYNQGPGLTNSYAYGQSGRNNPLYANNYNPNQYTYGEPFSGVGLQYSYNQRNPNLPYYGTGLGFNPYGNSGQSGMNPGMTDNPNYGAAQIQGQGADAVAQGQSMKGSGAAGATAALGAGIQAAQTAYGISQDFKTTSDFEVDKAVPYQQYHPRSAPPVYVKEEVPEEISEGTGGRAALNYAGQGMGAGAAVGSLFGPIGTAVGAGVGAVGGAVVGAFKGRAARKKREEFEDRQTQKRAQYREALGRYYDIQNQSRVQQARQQQLNQRSQPVAPMYGASIYGIGNY